MDASSPTNTFGNIEQRTVVLPARGRFAVLTCMDARLDPSQWCGVSGSTAHIVRNAGGRVNEDAVRSLLLAHALFGVREFFVVQHADCGLALVDEEITAKLWPDADAASSGAGRTRSDRLGAERERVIGRIEPCSQERILGADLARLRADPRLPPDVAVRGYIFCLERGRLREVLPAHGEV